MGPSLADLREAAATCRRIASKVRADDPSKLEVVHELEDQADWLDLQAQGLEG
jgi:hypothetical protein